MQVARSAFQIAWFLAAALFALVAARASAEPAAAGDPDKGSYLFAAAGGCGCHGPDQAGFKPGTPPEQSGAIFAGPFGSVPAANITSDRTTGVGDWTDVQLIDAIRNGVDNRGELLFPIMPYNSLHFMSDGDVSDLVAFVRTLPAVSNQVPERELSAPVPALQTLPPSPATAPTAGVERGSYLVSAVSLCGDCHTPQTAEGMPDSSKFLAGGIVPSGPGQFQIAPNITPDVVTGIGTWTEQQITTLLRVGVKPDGKKVTGLMEEVVVGGYNRLTDSDGLAIASFLKSIPAVSNVPESGGPPDGQQPGNGEAILSLSPIVAAALALVLITLGFRLGRRRTWP